MIDDMVAQLKTEQKDDDEKKEYCADEFDKADDKKKVLEKGVADLNTAIEDAKEGIQTTTSEIAALKQGIKSLDKSVAEATEQRKEEHATYVAQMQMNEAAMGLVEKAKNRMQKFYNPTLYKAPPKKEMSMEEKIMQAGSFVQRWIVELLHSVLGLLNQTHGGFVHLHCLDVHCMLFFALLGGISNFLVQRSN
jgi:chromosome segregation ATPase